MPRFFEAQARAAVKVICANAMAWTKPVFTSLDQSASRGMLGAFRAKTVSS